MAEFTSRLAVSADVPALTVLIARLEVIWASSRKARSRVRRRREEGPAEAVELRTDDIAAGRRRDGSAVVSFVRAGSVGAALAFLSLRGP